MSVGQCTVDQSKRWKRLPYSWDSASIAPSTKPLTISSPWPSAMSSRMSSNARHWTNTRDKYKRFIRLVELLSRPYLIVSWHWSSKIRSSKSLWSCSSQMDKIRDISELRLIRLNQQSRTWRLSTCPSGSQDITMPSSSTKLLTMVASKETSSLSRRMAMTTRLK